MTASCVFGQVVKGVVESLKIITRQASMRVAEYAFLYAEEHGRKRVSAIHKANIMKKTDGLFLQASCDGSSSSHAEIMLKVTFSSKSVEENLDNLEFGRRIGLFLCRKCMVLRSSVYFTSQLLR
jgi:isocitrate dehydrogenase